MTTNLGGLIDAENGLISRRIFIEPEIYAQELERIFARCWLFRTRACRGAVSRRALLNAQMGLGHERFDPDLNALASDFRISESNHRQFYRRWAQLMAADRWAQVPSGHLNGGCEAAP